MSKHNTEQAKVFLQKAISSIPADFSLREVRFHLQQAAQKLEHIEKRRAAAEPKTPTQYEQWRERLNNGLHNPYTGQNTIDIINDMLSTEQNKLNQILAKKKKTSSGEIEADDTLLG